MKAIIANSHAGIRTMVFSIKLETLRAQLLGTSPRFAIRNPGLQADAADGPLRTGRILRSRRGWDSGGVA